MSYSTSSPLMVEPFSPLCGEGSSAMKAIEVMDNLGELPLESFPPFLPYVLDWVHARKEASLVELLPKYPLPFVGGVREEEEAWASWYKFTADLPDLPEGEEFSDMLPASIMLYYLKHVNIAVSAAIGIILSCWFQYGVMRSTKDFDKAMSLIVLLEYDLISIMDLKGWDYRWRW